MSAKAVCTVLFMILVCLLVGATVSDPGDHWPQWRGPFFNGMARGDAPLAWSDKNNIKWKTEIPGRGFSTPVIWGDKIFLTTAIPTGKPAPVSAAEARDQRSEVRGQRSAFDERPAGPPQTQGAPQPQSTPPQAQGASPQPQNTPSQTQGAPPQAQGAGAQPAGSAGQGGPQRRGAGGNTSPQAEHKFEVLCLDRKTGKLIWQRTAKVAAPHEGYHRTYGSFASNSPATDGKRVYASFGSRGIYAYDFNGKLIWQKDPGVQLRMKLGFGEGSAPLLVDDRLFLVFDHEGESFIVALNKNTGKELWRSARDEKSSWSTPLAIEPGKEYGNKKQIIVTATNKVRSYDAETGKVIWETSGLGANAIPVPVFQNPFVYVMSGYRDPKLMSIKLGKEGDLSGSDSIVWSHTRGIAYTPSPVLYDNKLYVVTDNGMISCFNATTGEPHYTQVRLPKSYNFKASPVGANGKLYLATEDADVVVVKMGEKFEVLATNTLEDQIFIATPVIAGGELFLRSQNALFCISEK